ncbi:MAG: glyoxalase/bleomycin resistance/dioxygenase family protein [Hyphomicrobium sp.]|nr:glyoxalase/bleomycin resistance/dioxygenase family protein [Hyphomicrobium sp.]
MDISSIGNRAARTCVLPAIALALTGCSLLGGGTQTEVAPDDVILGVGFVGVHVDDVEAASRYYANSVATRPVETPKIDPTGALAQLLGVKSVDADTQLVRSANAQLWLMNLSAAGHAKPPHAAVPVQGPGIAHVCFQVARTTESYTKILAGGASPVGIRGLVQLNDRNPVHYGYVKDRQGIVTEIEEVDVAELKLPMPPKHSRRIRHVSLATPDLGAMIAFYQAFLGGQEPRHVGSWIKVSGDNVDKVSGLNGSQLEMAWFQIRNLELEIFQYHSHPTKRPSRPRPIDAPGYNMIVFDVSDLGAARKRLVDAGGTLVAGPVAFADGKAIFGRDPDGNLLVLQKVAARSPFSAKNFADNGI